jgi:hypothetical protein
VEKGVSSGACYKEAEGSSYGEGKRKCGILGGACAPREKEIRGRGCTREKSEDSVGKSGEEKASKDKKSGASVIAENGDVV